MTPATTGTRAPVEAYLDARLSGASLERAGRRVLTDIRWWIRPGERWVLAGTNGSGKTQLLKVIAGIVRPDPATTATVRWRLAGEWHRVPYEVKGRIAYLGPERQDKYQRYDWDSTAAAVVGTGIYGTDIPLEPLTPADRRAVHSVLGRLGMARFAQRRFLELSYGERRMVLLARALIARPALLLLDEVFNGLDAPNQQRLMRWLNRLRGRLPVVLATHQRADVPAAMTHLLVLRAGRIVHSGRLDGSSLARLFGTATATGSHTGPPVRRRLDGGHELVCLRRASVYLDGRQALSGVTLTIGTGQFWVVHGGNGAGKTTLLRTLYGDHGVAAGGSVVRAGIGPGVPLAEFRRWTGMSAPFLHASYPRGCTVAEVVLSGLHAAVGMPAPATPAERKRARMLLRRLKMARWATRTLRDLSHGQARCVLFARAIVHGPRLLLLDEPFDGLDAATRAALGRELVRMAAQGTAIVVAAHAAAEWAHMATHELELDAGRVRYAGPLRRPGAGRTRRATARGR
ncbi:MAG: ATP-binding cassette domain-containing protein [Proteobacteria bacterium]|nr:ATP-binding cassette domain-containing protein [Pseudomonadota bacterium]